MVNEVVIGVGVVAAAVAMFLFAYFNVYSGVHRSLENAKVGEVYNFEYEQPLHGDPERFLAKVLNVTELSESAISRLNYSSNYRRYDDSFVRTKHLVTCQTADGKIRNFYAERTRNCRRPLLAPVVFKAGFAHLL
jgi:hypothetical protein